MDENKNNKINIVALISFVGGLPLFLMLFTLFIAVLFVLGMLDSSGGSGGSSLVYESECNYEETKVTVMSKNNKEVLATISLEDYIIGVLCGEQGVCDGHVESINEHYIKTQIIVYKTYTLGRRGQYNSNTKSIIMKASTRDQQWCSIEKGCIYTNDTKIGEYYEGKPVYYDNTYPKDYDQSKFEDEELDDLTRSFTEEDLKLLRKYYADTYGELFLPDDYNKAVTSLTDNESTSYAGRMQNFWEEEANKGKTYEEILKLIPSSGVRYSKQYEGKSIYKLGNYCKVTNYGNSENSPINYVKWMIDFAADNNHGYSMENRTMNPDVDCSSFVYYALLNNGYTTSQLGGSPFSTAGMDDILPTIGFEQITYDINSLQEGDIVWYPAGFQGHKYGHTEVYVGNGQTVGAHSNKDGVFGDSSGKEVSVVSINREYKSIFRKKSNA